MPAARELGAPLMLLLDLVPCPRPVSTTWRPLSSHLSVCGVAWLDKCFEMGKVEERAAVDWVPQEVGSSLSVPVLCLCVKGALEFILQGE